MTSRRKRKPRDGSLVALLIAALPLAGAGALCAALYYGLGVLPPTPPAEEAHDQTRCVLVSPFGAADIREWERNLYVWAELRDPTLMVMPNEVLGFSRVRQRQLELSVAPVPAYMPVSRPAAAPRVRPPLLGVTTVPFPAKLAGIWQPPPPPPPEPVVILPLTRGVFWRHPDGRLLASPPEVSIESVRQAMAEETFPKYSTTLEVSRPGAGGIARVRVTRSCGNRRLDALAVEALRRETGLWEPLAAGVGAAGTPPEFLPPPGEVVPVEVEWGTGSEPLQAVAP